MGTIVDTSKTINIKMCGRILLISFCFVSTLVAADAWRKVEDTYLWGWTLKSLWHTTVENCKAECSKMSNCVGFYMHKEGNMDRCGLKRDIKSTQHNPGFDAYYKN